MAQRIQLPEMKDERGTLVVLEKLLPFEIKRLYWMFDVAQERGGHAHHKLRQGIVCLSGQANIFCMSSQEERTFVLESPRECLILEPEDWHTISLDSEKSVLLVVASEYYDAQDYIYDKPT